MKKVAKRILGFMLALFIGLNINTINSKADAYVSISVSSTQLRVGDSVSVSVSVSGSVSAYTLYVSYDSGVLDYSSCSGSAIGNGGGGSVSLSGTGEGTTTITFVASGNGESYVGTSGEAYDINGDDVPVSNAGVTIYVGAGSTTTEDRTTEKEDDKKKDTKDSSETTEKDDKSADCNLSSLAITPGTLEPAFSPDITSYYVHVEDDVRSMVVSAVAADSKAETAVYGADNIEQGENTIKVNVTAENGAVKVYYIRVVAGKELGDACATINNTMYRFINDTSKLEKPEGYTETTAKYKDWEVLAYEAPNKRFKIVCLVKEDDKDKEDASLEWYIIDETKEELTPYFELSSHMNKYIVIPKPAEVQLPAGFAEDKITIGQNIFTAYKSSEITDPNVSLVYAMNINGEEGFYMFDSKEVTFMRFVPVVLKEEVYVTATDTSAPAEVPVVPEPEDDNTKTILFYSTIALGVLFMLMTTWLIVTKVKKSKLKEELSKAEDMVSQLAAVNTTVNKDVLDTIDITDVDDKKKKSKKKNDKAEMNETTSQESDMVNEVVNTINDTVADQNIDDNGVDNTTSEANESVNDEKVAEAKESLFDDDKELQDIMDMVISEVKQSGSKNEPKVESDSHGNTPIKLGETYNAEADSAFIDTDNN